MFKIGNVVRLINDLYYGRDGETDHVFITNIHDGKFDGIGISENGIFRDCNLENWEETNECIYTKSGRKINVNNDHRREEEKAMYDIWIDGVGYIGVGLAEQLIKMIPILIRNEYADPYK